LKCSKDIPETEFTFLLPLIINKDPDSQTFLASKSQFYTLSAINHLKYFEIYVGYVKTEINI
jgi:hypothetical protein